MQNTVLEKISNILQGGYKTCYNCSLIMSMLNIYKNYPHVLQKYLFKSKSRNNCLSLLCLYSDITLSIWQKVNEARSSQHLHVQNWNSNTEIGCEICSRLIFLFFNCDSLHERLGSHYKAWSYKRKKRKKITTYRKSV